MVVEPQGFASLKLKAGECPFERLGGVIALGHERFGALAQLRDGRMTGVSQGAARVDGEQQLDLIDPACVQWREVKDKPPIVPGIELIPDGLRTVGAQAIPHDVHPALGVGLRHLLHEGHEVSLGGPCEHWCMGLVHLGASALLHFETSWKTASLCNEY
jgi:hypothetical protein